MDTRKVLVILLIIGSLCLSGCISGSNENLERWNEGVDTANASLTKGNTSQTAMQVAWESGMYTQAYTKGNEAIGHYDDAIDEITDLDGVAKDLKKDFLEDYVDAWKNQIQANVDYTENVMMLIAIEHYNDAYYDFFTAYVPAESQYIDAVNYYNASNYQAAISTCDLTRQKWVQLQTKAEEMVGIAARINIGYVTEYSAGLRTMCTHVITAVDYLRSAAVEVRNGNLGNADAYISLQNTADDAYITSINALIALENAYPSAFPDSGDVLVPTYNTYYDRAAQAQADVTTYRNEMDSIVADNKDFFDV